MTKQELVAMVVASLERISPTIDVSDIPSAFPGKRVLAANLPRGLYFKESGAAVIHVHYVAGNEEGAGRKLLDIAHVGVGGEVAGRERIRRDRSRRSLDRTFKSERLFNN
jgi:hypothetical protein